MSGDPVVAVPADLELEDRLAGPVTFRMAGWLATAAAGTALGLLSGSRAWALAPAAVLVLVGMAGAFWRPGGRPMAAWAGPLWSYRHRRRSAQASPTPLKPATDAAPKDPLPDIALPVIEPVGPGRGPRAPVVNAVLIATGLVLLLVAVAGYEHLWPATGGSADLAPGASTTAVDPLPPAAPERPRTTSSSAGRGSPEPPDASSPGSDGAQPAPLPPGPAGHTHDETDHLLADWPFCGC